jgi:hypothetical protein
MRSARGFTAVDLILTLAVLVVLVAVTIPMLSGPGCIARQLKDSAQVRAIHQGMIVWAQNGSDDYPIPSRIDRMNATVGDEGMAKNTTANIYSCMMFNGSLSPEIFVSPLEPNPNVRVCDTYEYDHPKGAVDPAHAMWDPKFSAALDGSRSGNVSYAHLQPSRARRARWANTFPAADPIVGTRGPEIASVRKDSDGSVTPRLANPRSNTLRSFGRGRSWSGNIAFNDNHVEFLKDWLIPGKRFLKPEGRAYQAADGKQWPDLWCHDEVDDPKAVNDYLGIFLKAGETPAEFKAAWD